MLGRTAPLCNVTFITKPIARTRAHPSPHQDPNKELLRVYSVPADAFAAVSAPAPEDDADGVDMGGEVAGPAGMDVTVPLVTGLKVADSGAADADDA